MKKIKQQKRLVHRHQYLKMLAEKSGLYSFSLILGGTACVFLLITAFLLVMVPESWRERADPDMPSYILLLLFSGFFGFAGIGTLWGAATLFKTALSAEKVAPITPNNTGMLPEIETLVRSADRPLPDSRVELLRAAGQGADIRRDQLLRPGQESVHNQ